MSRLTTMKHKPLNSALLGMAGNIRQAYGCHFLFSQKKVTKEKSRLVNALCRGCTLAGVVLPCVTLCRIWRCR
jgi:hypothetical protein